jgi:hypothetical protein
MSLGRKKLLSPLAQKNKIDIVQFFWNGTGIFSGKTSLSLSSVEL